MRTIGKVIPLEYSISQLNCIILQFVDFLLLHEEYEMSKRFFCEAFLKLVVTKFFEKFFFEKVYFSKVLVLKSLQFDYLAKVFDFFFVSIVRLIDPFVKNSKTSKLSSNYGSYLILGARSDLT